MLDAALRGSAAALFLLLGGLLLRDHPRHMAARLGAALAFGATAYAITSAPALAGQPLWALAPLAMLAAGNAVVLWLLSQALFDDEFRLRPWHGAVWLAFAGPELAGYLTLCATGHRPGGPLALAFGLGRIGLALLALVPAIASWRGDLVEARRRLRGWIVGLTGVYTVVDVAADILFRPNATPGPGATLNALGLATMALVMGWLLVRIGAAGLFAAPAALAVAAVVPPQPAEAKLVRALDQLMTRERAYRQASLTIGSLALKLGLPEYRLRRLINGQLGHRNFSAFVNGYRIDEAKGALADPAQAAVPVLTIALDAGFQSLGPFNRAFKAATGLTPTEFRRQALAAAGEIENRRAAVEESASAFETRRA